MNDGTEKTVSLSPLVGLVVKLRLRPVRKGLQGFSLIELLTVIAIMGILALLVAPAFSPPNGVEQASYGMADLIQTARSYAVGNNTYVYLGFAEYNGALPANGPQATGTGRVIAAAIATKDCTRGYQDTSYANALTSWQNSYNAGVNFSVVIPPQFYEHVHLAVLGTPPSTGAMARQNANANGTGTWSLGSTSFTNNTQTPFSLPLGSVLNSGKYNFNQVMIIQPDGSIWRQTSDSNFGLVSPLYLEIGLQPMLGNAANYAAISINGTTGASRVYRP